jgi:hypothetical protein
MMENSASPLPEAAAPMVADELAGRHGVSGLGQHFRDLQPRPFRAHRRLLSWNDNARSFDDRGEAGFCGFQHRDRRALGGVGFVGGEGWVGGEGEQAGGDCGEPFS